jgi:hypothetical protein
MIIGVLQIELDLRGAESLKDKRRVVKSLKDRLHREHMAAVAEVAAQDVIGTAVLGIAVVGSDGRHIGVSLDRILEHVRSVHEADVAATKRHLIRGDEPVRAHQAEPIDHDFVAEMIARAKGAQP